jgi:tetrahydromethanopterin S-methyltransferase subunit G
MNNEVETRIALVEQKVDLIINNHLHHMQQDIDDIKRYFGWAVGVVFVQLMGVIVALALML